jgi:hypothetical protein
MRTWPEGATQLFTNGNRSSPEALGVAQATFRAKPYRAIVITLCLPNSFTQAEKGFGCLEIRKFSAKRATVSPISLPAVSSLELILSSLNSFDFVRAISSTVLVLPILLNLDY